MTARLALESWHVTQSRESGLSRFSPQVSSPEFRPVDRSGGVGAHVDQCHLRARGSCLYVDGSARVKPRRHGIIAKALNYTGADGTAGPTTGSTDGRGDLSGDFEDRHPDIMREMDAASEPLMISRDSGRGALCADICTLQSLYY